jgi:holo-ACP synthase
MEAFVVAKAEGRTESAPAVSLEQILAARERRVARQAAALARFDKPLISVTVVMPGPVKDGPLTRRVMTEALRALGTVADDKRWRVLSGEGRWQLTGPEAHFVVDAGGWLLKSATVGLEDHHPLGGLWDLDVFAPEGLITRRQLGLAPRRCLVCERLAYVCVRSSRHPPEQLWSTIRQLVGAYDLRSVA